MFFISKELPCNKSDRSCTRWQLSVFSIFGGFKTRPYHTMIANVRPVSLILLVLLPVSASEDGVASKVLSEKIRKRCPYKLRKLWQTDASSFPFAAAPLVIDADGDGGLDIVAAPFGEALTVIEGETGKPLHDTSWPQHNLDKSVHSSALQYDINNDGVLDLLFMTSQGEGLFYTGLGHSLSKYNFQLEPAYVKSDWYNVLPGAGHQDIRDYITDKPTPGYIPVDPHVLATPVVDHLHSLVIPVSFYFDADDYGDTNGTDPWGSADARDKFFVGAVAVVDLKQMQGNRNHDGMIQHVQNIKIIFLELSQTPLYNLFSPTVVDVDGTFGESEIITGLSSGNIYLLSKDGEHRSGFPKSSGSMSDRISVANLNNEPGLELIASNTNGEVSCFDSKTGKVHWSIKLEGRVLTGNQIVDVNIDGHLDVVIATNDGKVYALHGINGTVIANYPFKTGHRISGPVLVTKFSAIRGPVDLVFLSDNGVLNILAADQSCLSQIVIGDLTLVEILVQNVMLMNHGMELIIATSDGSLICVGSGSESSVEEFYEDEFVVMARRIASPSSPHSQNDFVFTVKKVVILIDGKLKNKKEVTGSSFDLHFTLYGPDRGQKFDVHVYMGSTKVHQEMLDHMGPASFKVQTPEQPGQAEVTVVVYDQHGFVTSDSVFLKFNQMILLDLQWLILAPFIAMVIILLVNHGFPAKDLLPVTFPFKSK